MSRRVSLLEEYKFDPISHRLSSHESTSMLSHFPMDESFRTRQIKIIGRYAVTYWVDDPVKVVTIVSVDVADRLEGR